MAIKRTAASIWSWVEQNLLLSLRRYSKGKKEFSKSIDISEKNYPEELLEAAPELKAVHEQEIQRHREEQARRLKTVEDKARTNLFAIALGVTVMFAVLSRFLDREPESAIPGHFDYWILGFSVAAAFYFFMGGKMALRALETQRLSVPSLEDEAQLDPSQFKAHTNWVLNQNERTIQIRANALSSSFSGIITGVTFLCVAAAIVMAAILLG